MKTSRRVWLMVMAALVLLSAVRAGLDVTDLINTRGWSQVSNFAGAMFSPRLDQEFLSLTLREAATTVAFALLGTALALVIGLLGGVLLTERVWMPLAGTMGWRRMGWTTSRFALAAPRSVHEVVFGLLLVSVLGLNPLVAVLAIGIPFGAVTAKVFADLLDEVPDDGERALRAAGASRLVAMAFATFPVALGDLVSYSFYRFECALRSAAILGVVGAGGLGFQLALSFQTLRYEEMWTFLWALIIISAVADWWSSTMRRDHRSNRFLTASVVVCTVALPLAFWWLSIDITTLWSSRARMLGGELASDSWPPRLGPEGFGGLASDAIDTIALAVLSIAGALVLAWPLSFLAARPVRSTAAVGRRLPRRLVGLATRFVLLVSRSIPPPVGAFIAVFIFFPGLWPGVVALAIYNGGVLGRLQAEVVDNLDPAPAAALRASGATTASAIAFAVVPAVSGKFAALGLYRWEVAIRETVIVGVVGAAGLGRLLDAQTSAFDYDGILATILALLVVTVAVDVTSASIRRSLG